MEPLATQPKAGWWPPQDERQMNKSSRVRQATQMSPISSPMDIGGLPAFPMNEFREQISLGKGTGRTANDW